MASTREKTAALAAAGAATAAAAGVGIKKLRDSDGEAADSTAYRLLEAEPVGPGIRRVLHAQVDGAVEQLRGEAGASPRRRSTRRARTSRRSAQPCGWFATRSATMPGDARTITTGTSPGS